MADQNLQSFLESVDPLLDKIQSKRRAVEIMDLLFHNFIYLLQGIYIEDPTRNGANFRMRHHKSLQGHQKISYGAAQRLFDLCFNRLSVADKNTEIMIIIVCKVDYFFFIKQVISIVRSQISNSILKKGKNFPQKSKIKRKKVKPRSERKKQKLSIIIIKEKMKGILKNKNNFNKKEEKNKNKIQKKVQIIEGKEDNQKEQIQIVMAFWNIQGAPKQKMVKYEDEKVIKKKALIERIEQSISELAGQQGVALMAICEANLTDDEKRRHSILIKQINNYKQQQTASGMSTSSNNQKVNKILEQLNDDKIQIMRIQIGNKNITIIASHFSQTEIIRQKQIDKINIVTDQIEKMQDNLGTILLGDFNINMRDETQWNKFNKKFSYKFTKHINQNTRENRQIDNILTSKKLNMTINESAAAVGNSENTSDHNPIMLKIKIQMDQKEICEQIINQDEKLQKLNKEIKDMCLIKQQNERSFVEKISQKIKQIITRKKKLIERRFKTNKKWIRHMNSVRYNNIRNICYNLYQNLNKQQQEEEFNNHLKMIIQNLQNELYQDRIRNPRKYFQKFKKILGLRRNNEILEPGGAMYNKQQLITTNKEEQMDIVKEYFDNHYNQKNINNKNKINKLARRERENIIKNIENQQIATNKACSFDGISGKIVEMPKKVGINKTVPNFPINTAQERKRNNKKIESIKQKQIRNQRKNIKMMIRNIVKDQKKWHKLYQARQIYIPKKPEDKTIYACRPITILPTTVKLIETAILKQIKDAEKEGKIKKIDHRQTGFCGHRSTTFNLLRLIKRILHLQQTRNSDLIVIFYDFKGAFDSPLHGKAWEVLKKQGFPLTIIKQIFWLYGKTTINDQIIGRGFLQGGITSPRFYIQYQQQALEEYEQLYKKEMYEKFQIEKELDFLAFADDLAIIAEDQQEFEIIMKTFQNKMQEFGLQVNEEKSEYVIFSKSNKSKSIEMEFKKTDIKQILQKQNLKYKQSDKFKYLGIIIEQNLNLKTNEEFMKKKLIKYKAINTKLKYLTNNYNLIINTWSTFIRAQFMYGITLIKENQYVTTWKHYISKYNQTIASTLGIKGHIKAEDLTEILNISSIYELEIEYKKHILMQIEELTLEQQNYYNLNQIKRNWNIEIKLNQKKRITIGNKNILKKDIKHFTKKILDYEGSLKVIQFIIKWKSKALKYFCECHQKRATFKHIMRYKLGMNEENQRKQQEYDQRIEKWKMNQEIQKILQNREIKEIIQKRRRREYPTIEEGFAHTLNIPNNILRQLLLNNQKYKIETQYTINSNLSSLESY